MSENKLVVVNNTPADIVVARQADAMNRLFQVKPRTLELVPKSTRDEKKTPGMFRVVTTGEEFKSLRAVILFTPVEQREKYIKGEYSKDSKQCFSLDNYQPHPKAKNPPAMFCETCPSGERMWVKYREMANKGLKGTELSAYQPECRKYWHLFLAARDTLVPYYYNVKGTSVRQFERDMQQPAELMMKMVQNIRSENRQRAAKGEAQVPEPTGIGDLIWQMSFELYSFLDSGVFKSGMRDFRLMSPDDQKDFSKLLQDFAARKQAGQIQTQMDSEAEAETQLVTETPAQQKQSEVAQKNAQIVI